MRRWRSCTKALTINTLTSTLNAIELREVPINHHLDAANCGNPPGNIIDLNELIHGMSILLVVRGWARQGVQEMTAAS